MSRARILLLAVLAVPALFAALELGLAAAGFSAPVWYRPDPHLGWALRPGASGWFTEEGRAFIQVNSAGQRDREHALDKPADVYRIAVLGDAYSEAMQVALEDTYWAQLPARLESCGFQPGKRIEVLNFSVANYGTAQAYLVLERTAVRYRPDLVLLQFDNGNDVRDNSYALNPIRNRPFFRLDGDGRLRLDNAFTSDPSYARSASSGNELFRNIVDRSRVLQLARDAVHELRLASNAHAKKHGGNEAGLEVEALAPPRDPRWDEAWRVTEALIAKLGEFASRNGASVAVVAVPFAIEVHPDRAWRERLQAKYGVADFAYPDRRVVSFARQNGMHAVMLAPEMKALADATGSHLYGHENLQLGFYHWNKLGHRVAADIIARSLCGLVHPAQAERSK
jgi:hypothetical protein